MKHDEPRQYEMCCAPGRSTTLDAVYERELAAKFSLFLFLWPGRRKTILLTSPFIERIAPISQNSGFVKFCELRGCFTIRAYLA